MALCVHGLGHADGVEFPSAAAMATLLSSFLKDYGKGLPASHRSAR